MWVELFQDAKPIEIAQILLLIAGMGFVLITPLVWICAKVVALNEKPDKRALWTVSIAYAGAALLFIFGSGDFISPWLAPIVPIPGAIVIFLWLRHTYRKGWIDDDKIEDGIKLENNDWRIGLGVVGAAILTAAIRAIFLRL